MAKEYSSWWKVLDWTSRPVIMLPDRNESFCDAKTKPLHCHDIAMVLQKNMGGDFSMNENEYGFNSQIFQAKTFRDRESFVANCWWRIL